MPSRRARNCSLTTWWCSATWTPSTCRAGHRALQDIADFVRVKGGGLLFLSGEHGTPAAYLDTPLADVLPVIPSLRARDRITRVISRGYRPKLTATGRQHPLFRFSPDEGEAAAIWNRLQPLYWYATGYRRKPNTVVLAVHPDRARRERRSRRASSARRAVVRRRRAGVVPRLRRHLASALPQRRGALRSLLGPGGARVVAFALPPSRVEGLQSRVPSRRENDRDGSLPGRIARPAARPTGARHAGTQPLADGGRIARPV